MECGKLTAKLRDAVQVCFMVDGKEVKRFKNIEIPNEIKKLPYIDFKFDVPASGAITFKIHFAQGVLPEAWPEPRQRQHRNKAPYVPQAADDATPASEIPATMQIAYEVIGERRKALVAAIGNYLGIAPVYRNAPTFAYAIGEYMVGKTGTLVGPADPDLIEYLASEGFIKR